MGPKSYEILAAQRLEALHGEAEVARMFACPKGRREGPGAIWRWLVVRLASVGRRRPVHVARPGGDLRPPGRAQLRQDVLDVGARRLRRDPE